jgi:hypothetical protein
MAEALLISSTVFSASIKSFLAVAREFVAREFGAAVFRSYQ